MIFSYCIMDVIKAVVLKIVVSHLSVKSKTLLCQIKSLKKLLCLLSFRKILFYFSYSLYCLIKFLPEAGRKFDL